MPPQEIWSGLAGRIAPRLQLRAALTGLAPLGRFGTQNRSFCAVLWYNLQSKKFCRKTSYNVNLSFVVCS